MSYALSQDNFGKWIVHFEKNGVPKVESNIFTRESWLSVQLLQDKGNFYSILSNGDMILHKTFDSWKLLQNIGNETSAVIPYLA